MDCFSIHFFCTVVVECVCVCYGTLLTHAVGKHMGWLWDMRHGENFVFVPGQRRAVEIRQKKVRAHYCASVSPGLTIWAFGLESGRHDYFRVGGVFFFFVLLRPFCEW